MATQPRSRGTFEGKASTSRSARSVEQLSMMADETSVRAFIKWCNFHLSNVGDKVTDLSVDFRDGKRLLKLLEVVSGEKLPRPERASMRIHYIQNVAKSLKYLEAKLGEQLANCSAEDIVDGNVKLTLAVLYQATRFQLQLAADDPTLRATADHARLVKKASKEASLLNSTVSAKAEVDASNKEKASTEKAHGDAKASILAWCNAQIAEYVKRGQAKTLADFSVSWRTGLAFSALLHRHDRYLLPDFPKLAEKLQSSAQSPAEWASALKHAFKSAEKYLNIPQVIEPEDLVDVEKPDEKIVLACLTGWYSTLSKIQRTPEWLAMDDARWQEADPMSWTEAGIRKWEQDQEAQARMRMEKEAQSGQPKSNELEEGGGAFAKANSLPEDGQIQDRPPQSQQTQSTEEPAQPREELDMPLPDHADTSPSPTQAEHNHQETDDESHVQPRSPEGPASSTGALGVQHISSSEDVSSHYDNVEGSVELQEEITAEAVQQDEPDESRNVRLDSFGDAADPVSPVSEVGMESAQDIESPEDVLSTDNEEVVDDGKPLLHHAMTPENSTEPHSDRKADNSGDSSDVDVMKKKLEEWATMCEDLMSELVLVSATSPALLEADQLDRVKVRSLQEELSGFREIIASAAQEGRDLLSQDGTRKSTSPCPPFDEAVENAQAYVIKLDAEDALIEKLVSKLIQACQSYPSVDSPALASPNVIDSLPTWATAPPVRTNTPDSPAPLPVLLAHEKAISKMAANQSNDKGTTDVERSIFTPAERRAEWRSSRSGSGIAVDGWMSSAESFIEDCEVMLKRQREAAVDVLWRPMSLDKRSNEEKTARCEAGVAKGVDFHNQCRNLDKDIEVTLNKGRALLAKLEGSAADDDLVRATLVESVLQRLESATFITLKCSREFSRLPTQTRAARFFEEKARKYFHAVRNVEARIASVPISGSEDGEVQDSNIFSSADFSFKVYEALRKVELELELLTSHFADLETHRFSITPLSKSIVLLTPDAVAQFELGLDDTLAVPRDRLVAACALASTAAEKARAGITEHCTLRPAADVAAEASRLMDIVLERLQKINDPRESPLSARKRKIALSDCYSQVETMVKPKVEAVKGDESYPSLKDKLERLDAFKLTMVAHEASNEASREQETPLPPVPLRAPELPKRIDSKTALSVPRRLPVPPSPTSYQAPAGKERGRVLSWMERKIYNRRQSPSSPR